MNTLTLQFLHGVLRRFGLEFVGGFQIRHISEMHTHGIAPQLPFQLTDGFQERGTLDVADSTANLRNHEIIILLFTQILNLPFDFVGDMRDHLNGLSQVISAALLVNNRLVDTSCRHRIGARCLNACEAFVVSKIEIGLHAIGRHVALSMLIRVQRSGVDVDVGVKLLNGDFETP